MVLRELAARHDEEHIDIARGPDINALSIGADQELRTAVVCSSIVMIMELAADIVVLPLRIFPLEGGQRQIAEKCIESHRNRHDCRLAV
jgi:hypothetical protein